MFKRTVLSFIVAACAATAAEAPCAEAVLGKYLEASGGKAAYDKVKTMTTRGSIEFVGQGIKGTISIASARPDRVDTVMELPGIGKIRTAVSDGVAWRNSAIEGPAVLKGEERDQYLRTAIFDVPARWREVIGEVKLDGEDTLDGKPCWRIVAMPPHAGKPETLWFDRNTGLLVKSAATLVSPAGAIPVVSIYLDYRDVEGLRIPVRIRQSMGPQVIETLLDDVKLNPELPPTQFDLPNEIRNLLNK